MTIENLDQTAYLSKNLEVKKKYKLSDLKC